MTILRFTDGDEYHVGGPLRAEHRNDGWYVIGQDNLIPVDDREEAESILLKLGAYTARSNETSIRRR